MMACSMMMVGKMNIWYSINSVMVIMIMMVVEHSHSSNDIDTTRTTMLQAHGTRAGQVAALLPCCRQAPLT